MIVHALPALSAFADTFAACSGETIKDEQLLIEIRQRKLRLVLSGLTPAQKAAWESVVRRHDLEYLVILFADGEQVTPFVHDSRIVASVREIARAVGLDIVAGTVVDWFRKIFGLVV